jgi:hypothetical protein
MKVTPTTMKKNKSGARERKGGASPSRLIDGRIKELGDWRGETLARVRRLIRQADPEMVEEWKWRFLPGFHDGVGVDGLLDRAHDPDGCCAVHASRLAAGSRDG